VLTDGNEESVGQGLRESGAPRGDVFITTKFFPTRKDPVAEIERSLQRLGVHYVDPCHESGIALEAYRPLGTGRHLISESVAAIAQRHGRTPDQVLLRWCVERRISVIPKSTHRERIAGNAQIFGFALSAEDIAERDALDRTDRALERKWSRS
jgi:diketogulonate reductase-like aldo/keto reductase